MATLESARSVAVRWGCVAVATGSAVALAMAGAGAAAAAPLPPPPKVVKLLPLKLPKTSIWGDAKADAAASASGAYSAAADPGSLYTVENAMGARNLWMQRDSANRQITGQGVGVAVLDSGVNTVAGLSGSGKVVYGPDLSIEANGPLTDQDTFGHGTHLAGIIAAHDPATLTTASIPKLDPSTQLGIAPDATIEGVKLGATDGSTDVSQVIAALNWVAEHQTLPNGTRIRVVNLAFGTDSLQAYQSDPLAAAAENAWRHGLVVVVSGGNEGPDADRLTDPAMDPYVLAVGASDGSDTVAGWKTPGVADFSQGGTYRRHVDVLAPGRSVVSLRDPGSFVDTNHPEGRVLNDTSGRLFRGSGTSQAAAVAAGAAALLLQAFPNATPDQIKLALMATTTRMVADPTLAGAGQIDVFAAYTLLKTVFAAKSVLRLPADAQWWPVSTGQGSIEAARGGDNLVDPDGEVLSGEIDVQGNRWDSSAWWSAASALRSWQGGSWNGAAWTGTGWNTSTNAYASARWSSARWSSARWSDADWDSARWSSARWSDADWDSARWSDDNWN